MSEPQTVIRAFELPIQGVDPAGAWEVIRRCYREASLLANWCAQTLLRNDVVVTPGMGRLPPMPPCDLYALAFGRSKPRPGRKDPSRTLPAVEARFGGDFWRGAMVSANNVIQAAAKKYRAERLNVLWHRNRSPVTYRAVQPFPVHAQAWKRAWLDGQGRPHVEVVLPGGAVTLRLRGGPEFGRQMANFRKVVEGELPRLQLVLRPQPRTDSFHRRGKGDSRDVAKMVAELPVAPAFHGRVMTLCVLPEAFWAAELDGRPAWVANADHVRRAMGWLAAHHERLQRLRQDAKAERRCCVESSRAWGRSLERCCAKHARRMSSWLHEMAAHAVGFAVRQRVGELCYDDSKREGLPLFPWHKLKSLLADKCAAAGMVFHDTAPQEDTDGNGDAVLALGATEID